MIIRRYIIRFDDACPTMDKKKWDRVLNICDKYDIKPIIAVVPDNKDKKLIKDDYDNNFWDKVRNWQQKGYHIALHGYNHLYITHESGFLPFNKKSEFAGLSYEEQTDKIKNGWKVFQKEKIECNIWVAPSHTFDENTLKALKKFTTIKIVSDGIGIFPFKKYGFNWLPQQIWKFRKMPFGVWTSCFHPNEMKEEEFKNLEIFIIENKNNFHFDIKKLQFKNLLFCNLIFTNIYKIMFFIKKLIKK